VDGASRAPNDRFESKVTLTRRLCDGSLTPTNGHQREQLLFEQQASEQRAAEQQALEERQALEKANRYQACLGRATDNYNASRLTACNRPQEKIIKDHDDCIKLGFSKKVCDMAHAVRETSPNCALPRAVALALDADVEKARDRCLEEDGLGLQ
jgi:hypothetical protein